MHLQPPTPVAGHITRRTLLKATTAPDGALATAVAFAEETPGEAAASFVKGVDISWHLKWRRAATHGRTPAGRPKTC
ncbi:hypothetical protein [Streptomyces collinus]|uniref:hypothetical protein n=1 Tax=Streptomyces collinus TaxID=42684 RepID=UPI0038269ABA